MEPWINHDRHRSKPADVKREQTKKPARRLTRLNGCERPCKRLWMPTAQAKASAHKALAGGWIKRVKHWRASDGIYNHSP